MAGEALVVFGGEDVRVGHGVSPSGGDRDVLERDACNGGVRLAPYDTGHLATLEIGVAVCRADIFEGDISYRTPLVCPIRHPRDVGDFDENGREGLLHPDVLKMEALDDAAVVGGDADARLAGP